MYVRLPEEKNPYSKMSPYDVLGVSPSATARELHAARLDKLEDINYADYDEKTRITRRNEVEQAYTTLRDVRSRVSVVMFMLDQTVGEEGSRQAAQKHKILEFDFSRILEHSDAMFPVAPKFTVPKYNDIVLASSRHFEVESALMEIDHQDETLSSITFER